MIIKEKKESEYYGEIDWFNVREIKQSNLWINKELKKNFDSAAVNGTPLYNFKKISDLWRTKPVNVDDEIRHFILRDTYGWFIPYKEYIDHVLENTSENQLIMELGCGTGHVSAILSHYRNIMPVDNKTETVFDYRYTNIIEKDCVQMFMKYRPEVVIMNYPRIEYFETVFKEAEIGTTFFINIPFIAADFNYDYVNWITESSEIFDYSHSCSYGQYNFSGVSLIKSRNIEIEITGHKFSVLDRIEKNWKNFKKFQEIQEEEQGPTLSMNVF